jgi:hypothetical protein
MRVWTQLSPLPCFARLRPLPQASGPPTRQVDLLVRPTPRAKIDVFRARGNIFIEGDDGCLCGNSAFHPRATRILRASSCIE